MIRNETFQNGICIEADIIDLDAGTFTREEHGQIIFTRPLTIEERQQYAKPPLDPTGALATLLAVLELSTVEDAANAVGLTPEDLVAEAEAWAANV
jgi:bifunctional ADP-heptose synthase (sugar kinase/adenylyltransferase)